MQQRNIKKMVWSTETIYIYISLYKNINMGGRLATLTLSISFIKLNIYYIYTYILIHKYRYKNTVYHSTILRTGTEYFVAVLKIQNNRIYMTWIY